MKPEVLIIGGGVVDIPVCPVNSTVFDVGSFPAESISMQVGGDAVNESIIISRLGHGSAIASKIGMDGAGDFILKTLNSAGVNTDHVIREAGLDTGINIVLIGEDAERRFITNRNGSLRRLAPEDIYPAIESKMFQDIRVVCLASMFVSPLLTCENTPPLFERIKAEGKILCADTTRRKNGETIHDIAPMLKYLDYFFPNYEEAALIAGSKDLDEIADAFLSCGVKNVVIKIGANGCYLKNADQSVIVPAYSGANCIDTTGAGDNFAAAFITAVLEGKSFVECGRYANAAASVCVEKVGAVAGIQDRSEVDRRYAEMRRN